MILNVDVTPKMARQSVPLARYRFPSLGNLSMYNGALLRMNLQRLTSKTMWRRQTEWFSVDGWFLLLLTEAYNIPE